jgi:ATP-dependent DNA ligase
MSRHESLPGKRGHREQDFNRYEPNWTRTEPAFIVPMQCKPAPALPAGENWTFEIKFDGYRSIAVKRGKEVMLFSRREKVLGKRFPGILGLYAPYLGASFEPMLKDHRASVFLAFTVAVTITVTWWA